MDIEKEVFRETYNLLKRYSSIKIDTDEKWEELIKDSTEVNIKLGNHQLSRDIILAILDYLELREKGGIK